MPKSGTLGTIAGGSKTPAAVREGGICELLGLACLLREGLPDETGASSADGL
jgi:hypothetical protein